jgi:flavin-dependent dehydrogenase
MPEDIAIIGGSAAGFYAAYQLAKKGLGVRVFEAKHALDPSPRTLIVTRYMSRLIGPLCEDSVVNRIWNYDLYADGRFANVSLQHPDVVIERSTLIRSLAKQAQASGVKIHTGHRFLGLRPNGRRLTFMVSPNSEKRRIEESADVLIGADGAFSRVAQSAGWPQQPTAPLVQAIVRLPDDMPPDTTRIWFVPKDTPYFYWLIPFSSTHGVLGLIGEEQRKTRENLEGFLKTKALEPLEFQTSLIPRYRNWIPFRRTIEGSHVYLVGDAAGHVKVTTVGGLVTGFRGARGIVDAITNGGSSRRSNALRLELDLHLLIRKALNHFREKDYAMLLGLLTPSVKRSLSCFHRDETGKLLLQVFLKNPRLLLLGLRSLLFGE